MIEKESSAGVVAMAKKESSAGAAAMV